MGFSYLRNAYYVIIFCCFTHVFVDSACQQLSMASSHAPNLLRPNNMSGDITDDFVIILYFSLNKSPNRAMCTSL